MAASGERAALDEAVAGLYSAFRGRRLPMPQPTVCTGCCASPEAMARLGTTPLGEVGLADLREFHDAARSDLAGEEVAYFAPRTLDLVGQGFVPMTAGLFALFPGRPSIWPELAEGERDALRDALAALMAWRLTVADRATCGWRVGELIEMATCGGMEMEPLLAVIAEPPDDPVAAENLADLVLHGGCYWGRDRPRLDGVPTERRQEMGAGLRAALSAPGALALLERAALSDGEPDLAGRASAAHQIAERLEA